MSFPHFGKLRYTSANLWAHTVAMADWARVWSEVDKRRQSLGMSKADLYRASGLSEATFRKMAAGVPLARLQNRQALAAALLWPADWLTYIERGKRVPINQHVGETAAPDMVGRVDRIDHELSELRAYVLELATTVARLSRRRGDGSAPTGRP